MTTVVGVDCATDPRRVGLALGRWDGSRTTLVEVRHGSAAAPPAEIVARWIDAHDGPVLLALDAPLGWPAPLGEGWIWVRALHRPATDGR